MCDVIVVIPDYCLSIYFSVLLSRHEKITKGHNSVKINAE